MAMKLSTSLHMMILQRRVYHVLTSFAWDPVGCICNICKLVQITLVLICWYVSFSVIWLFVDCTNYLFHTKLSYI